ncbi:putative sodium/metabolite cotransporter [Chloropicon primus]|uniref:Putative sodium/metabolite cotransporter n=1 Tax=Chloropicon primus TaxID=1764295 RepID=A0A5B8MXP0_9CHLO|nr:putative sodium/metabolite cotransporter [Chloropicon primus]UPR03457.1 putative sodium/metabolite cotransporter [Chloropicon primus]|eukprot:QDZ24250.1 putative sodium/metabolite cotransporter [Chloropicon primus]
MPYGLVAAICVSVVEPRIGCKVHALRLHKLSAPGIFLISGLMLKLGEVKRALKSPLPLLLGLCTISLVLPLSAQLALRWPFLSQDLVYGMAIFLCMPTALSTGVQICTHYGGNPALALMLTVGSNLLSIATIPFFVSYVLAQGSEIKLSVDAFVLFKSLVKSILVPMLAGVALRSKVPRVTEWVDANKKALSMVSASLLISVPLAELSSSVAKGLTLLPSELAQVAALGVCFPAAFMAFNAVTTRCFLGGLPQDIRKTLVIVCSLKTLPSAVMVVQKMQEIVPTLSGAALVPCMMFHIIQTLLISAAASGASPAKQV